jgi:hypothetical protein
VVRGFLNAACQAKAWIEVELPELVLGLLIGTLRKREVEDGLVEF